MVGDGKDVMPDMDDQMDQLGSGPWSSKFRVQRIRDMAFHCNQGLDDPTCQLMTLRIANLVEQQGLELEQEQALVREPTAEALLQIRTVSHDEVRRNLQEWVPAMGEELQALVQNHDTISRPWRKRGCCTIDSVKNGLHLAGTTSTG